MITSFIIRCKEKAKASGPWPWRRAGSALLRPAVFQKAPFSACSAPPVSVKWVISDVSR